MPVVVLYILGSVLFVSLVSLIGIVLFFVRDAFINKLLFCLIGFAAGGLIGDVFIHILPEIVADGPQFFPIASLIIVAGLLLSFVLEKIIHWRHCHDADCVDHVKPFGIMNLVGDGMHNFIDGVLIAGSYLVSVQAGIATTIAVALHEIPQEIGDYAVLLHSGYSKSRALFLNIITALVAVAGALFVVTLTSTLPNIEKYFLPVVAGNFLYIAVADLLPELHKQTRLKDSGLQLLSVCAGIALMFLLTFIEA
jgi:zinc and cadmium transporter